MKTSQINGETITAKIALHLVKVKEEKLSSKTASAIAKKVKNRNGESTTESAVHWVRSKMNTGDIKVKGQAVFFNR